MKQKGRREKLQIHMEQARLSRVLVELERRVPKEQMTFPEGIDRVSDLRMSPMDPDGLVNFFDEMGLRDLKRRFEARLEKERGFRGNNGASREDRGSKQTPPKRSKFVPRPKAGIPRPEDFSDVPF